MEKLLEDPLLRDFNRFLINMDLKMDRRVKYLLMVRRLRRFFNLEEDNVDRIMAWIRENYKGFIREYLSTLKYYYRFRGYDEKAREIKASVKKSEIRKIMPRELLTEEEVYRMVNSTKNIMYRALIMLLWKHPPKKLEYHPKSYFHYHMQLTLYA